MMMLSAIGERLEPLDMNWLSRRPNKAHLDMNWLSRSARSARSGYFFRDQQVNDPVALGSFSKIPWLKFRAPLKEGASRALPIVSFFVSWRLRERIFFLL